MYASIAKVCNIMATPTQHRPPNLKLLDLGLESAPRSHTGVNKKCNIRQRSKSLPVSFSGVFPVYHTKHMLMAFDHNANDGGHYGRVSWALRELPFTVAHRSNL